MGYERCFNAKNFFLGGGVGTMEKYTENKHQTLTKFLKTYETDTGSLILSLKTYKTDTGSLILSLRVIQDP